MDLFAAMTAADVAKWFELRRSDAEPLYWFGTAAECIGMEGEADPEAARHLLIDGIGRYGIWLANAAAPTYERGNMTNFRYSVRFSPDKTVRALLADPEAREAVVAAHQAAMADALRVWEFKMQVGLAGVVATDYSTMMSEVVVAASGWSCTHGWRPLNKVHEFLYKAEPAIQAALETYQRRLGEELGRRLGVEVAYEVSPENYGAPVAVV